MRLSWVKWMTAGLACGLLFFSTMSVSAANLSSQKDDLSRQMVSVAADHDIRLTTPSGVDSPTDTITLTFANEFDLSAVNVADIQLSHGAGTGFETVETLASTAAAGVWGASTSSHVLTLTAPSDAGAGEIAAGQKIVIRIGQNVTNGRGQIINPANAGNHSILFGGTFGDRGSVTLVIVASDTVGVSATVPGQAGGPGGGGCGGGCGQIDNTPPVISNIQIQSITATSAQVVWQTDESADSKVEYGQDLAYASGTITSGVFTQNHILSLSGLAADTNYHVRVTSKDGVGNAAVSGDVVFRTLASAHAPVISNVRVVSITDQSAVVLWDTDVVADSLVRYGLDAAYGSTASAPGHVTNHSVSVSGLTPNTLYHYRVESVGGDGSSAVSGDATFTTLQDTTPPANVSALRAVSGVQQVTLSWINPADADFLQVTIVARTDRYPLSIVDGRRVYQGAGTSVLDDNLSGGVKYYYGVFAEDVRGNRASGAFVDATPQGQPQPPEPLTPPETPPEPPPTDGRGPLPPGGNPTTTTVGTTTSTPSVTTSTQPVVTPTSTEAELPDVLKNLVVPIEFYANSGALFLLEDAQGKVGVLANRSIVVRIPVSGLPSLPTGGSVQVGDALYGLTPTANAETWSAGFVPGTVAGEVRVIVTLRFAQGVVSVEKTLLVQTSGQILEAVPLSASRPVAGATITLLENGTVWAGQGLGQPNPVISGVDGSFAFLVPNGSYRITVKKEGYVDVVQNVDVFDHVVHLTIVLHKLPQNIVNVIQPQAPFLDNAKAVTVEAIRTVQQFVDTIRTPETQAFAEKVLAPTVVTVGAANLATAVSAFNFFNYLRFLFTQPLLLFARRKRRNWGTVYDALTKQPIELAIVRLFAADRGILLQTRITNLQGQYTFSVKPGRYVLQIAKPGFAFPTAYLKQDKEDVDFLDLYHGELIEVTTDANIAANVPLDPIAHEETPHKILFKKVLRKVQAVAGVLGVVLTAVACIIKPSLVVGLLLLAQIIIYVLFRRLAMPTKPKDWGIIYDETTHKPLDKAIVRVFHKKFNKLLETQVTDNNGKFGFLVGKSEYYIVAEKPGYQKYQSEDLDLTKKTETVIDRSVPLKKV